MSLDASFPSGWVLKFSFILHTFPRAVELSQ